MLTVRDLVVRYDDHVAVDHVDLAARPGEVVCVLGPSGGGKSSLLRAIAGLEPPAAGTVAWDGVDLAATPPHRRRFGLMFQDHALFPHRDVAANVAFGLRMQGVPTASSQARVGALLELVGLAGFERRAVRELSGGEQQRVALARALAPDPRLLMLDEPLGALDRVLRERLVTELGAIFARRERTILLVTHDHEEAFALADRVVLIHDGRVEQDARAVTVWQAPANAWVAEFLGYNVTAAFGGLVAVRPDGLRLTPDGSVPVTVVDRTFRRDHFRVRVRTDAGELLEVAVRPDQEGARDTREPGSATRVGLVPGAAVTLGSGTSSR
jgi:thiamine transport system ATP-binding protein